ncbi:MAG: AbrB/MazE/SpoVT family DNA-binding domain-containing protein [Nanoarchaeota archaeon]|nr:AbrB/MazE/SpoVT family DNA-binding domain-containing protein [Nanoarchaeota archaeon]
MKLQKQKSDYKRGYHKYVVVIPNDVVEKSGLKEGDELKAEAEKNKIVLRKER